MSEPSSSKPSSNPAPSSKPDSNATSSSKHGSNPTPSSKKSISAGPTPRMQKKKDFMKKVRANKEREDLKFFVDSLLSVSQGGTQRVPESFGSDMAHYLVSRDEETSQLIRKRKREREEKYENEKEKKKEKKKEKEKEKENKEENEKEKEDEPPKEPDVSG